MTDRSHYSPLLKPDWKYIEKVSLEDFTADDWTLLNRQRTEYAPAEQARQVLRMLASSKDDPTFGYMVNNYRHSLQSASMALRDGLPEEDIVVALLHDVGFIACPSMHGAFAATLMGAYISDRNYWMLNRHAVFQNLHSPGMPGVDQHERERWRGHAHFEWAATFVAKYDQDATNPHYDLVPLETFVPMVKRLFARPPKPRNHDD